MLQAVTWVIIARAFTISLLREEVTVGHGGVF